MWKHRVDLIASALRMTIQVAFNPMVVALSFAAYQVSACRSQNGDTMSCSADHFRTPLLLRPSFDINSRWK